MARRGALEMSVSTIVVLILGILILTGGMVIVFRLVGEGSAAYERLSSRDSARIRELLSSGQLVAVAPAIGEVEAGRAVTFGAGITNRLEAQEEFGILVEIYNESQGRVTDWRVQYFPTLAIASNADDTALIVVEPSESTPAGEYTGLVTVTAQGAPYDSTRFFTLRVR